MWLLRSFRVISSIEEEKEIILCVVILLKNLFMSGSKNCMVKTLNLYVHGGDWGGDGGADTLVF